MFFSATGVTDGDVLQGVRYPSAGGATTESLVTRSRSGTIRRIRATHDRSKLRAIGGRAVLRLQLRVRVTALKRPTRDSARSRRVSERRKP